MKSRAGIVFSLAISMMLLAISSQAQTGRLQVIASHSILADVARNVAGDQADVGVLIPQGSDPHSFTPSPSDLTKVAEADLVLINGAGYEESLLSAILSAGEAVNIVNASACIEVRPFGAGMRHDDDHADDDDDDHADEHDDEHADEDGDEHHADEDDDEHADEDDDHHADEDDDEHADEHDDEHADEDDDEHADEDDDEHADEDEAMGESRCDAHDAELAGLVGEEDGHAHFTTLGRAEDIDCEGGHGHEHDAQDHSEGVCDAHVWMDPHNVIYWVLMMRDVLSESDPGNAAHYAAAAHAYADELVALEAEFILPLLDELPLDRRVLVTSHESLGYLATTFDFEIITTVVPGASTSVEPSARDVAALIDHLRSENIVAMFGDDFVSQGTMRTIAAEAGIALVGLYSDTLSDSDGPASTYLEYMRFNVTTIVEALKG